MFLVLYIMLPVFRFSKKTWNNHLYAYLVMYIKFDCSLFFHFTHTRLQINCQFPLFGLGSPQKHANTLHWFFSFLHLKWGDLNDNQENIKSSNVFLFFEVYHFKFTFRQRLATVKKLQDVSIDSVSTSWKKLIKALANDPMEDKNKKSSMLSTWPIPWSIIHETEIIIQKLNSRLHQ